MSLKGCHCFCKTFNFPIWFAENLYLIISLIIAAFGAMLAIRSRIQIKVNS